MKVVIVLCILLASLHGEALKNIKYKDILISKVTSIYDGDSFRANMEGYPAIVGNRMAIRIKGIDTPEIRGKCELEKVLARKAKQQTVMMLRGAKKIELKNISRGKYFRIVADVFVDDVILSQILLDSKLAVTYDGGTKTKDWCK